MTSRKTRKIDASLTKKGFVREDSHHIYYKFCIDGKVTSVYTYVSHGNQEVDSYLLRQMADQIGLNVDEFKQFIDCHLDREHYMEIIRQKGII